MAINSGHYIRFTLNKPVLQLYKFYFSTYWYWIVWLADITLLLLPCIERPAYLTEVPSWVALLIEIPALAILAASFLITLQFQDKKKLLKEAVFPFIFTLVLLLTIVDMIIYYSLLANSIYYVRWTRPLRVLFPFALQTGQNIRRIIRNILRTLPNIANVMFLFLLSVLMFTLLGVGIFRNKGFRYPDNEPYFTYYFDTAWDLYVLTTTSNNPDVMMPAFNKSMLYVIFFVAYLLVTLYLFMSLLLAVIFSNYKQHLEEEQELIRKRHLDSLMTVFERLTAHQTPARITYETYHRLMLAMKSNINENLIEAYWITLDKPDKTLGLDLKQLNELVFNLNFELRPRNAQETLLQKYCPKLYTSKPSRIVIDFVNTGFFRAIINILIIGNAICLAANYSDIEWFFLAVFVLEAVLKMYAVGVREYFHHRWNIFDFTIVFVSTGYSFFTAIIEQLELNRDLLDAILVVRVLRLVKLVGNINRFKVIFGTFSKVIPTLITYLRVMFMTYYIFAMIGMELFQYKIQYIDVESTNETDSSLALMCNNILLNGSEFARMQYCRNNFNDYLSSLILLFTLTVVNQWNVLAGGFVLVTTKWARLYFLLFHLCVVIVVLNIFTAFVIDSFLNQYALSQNRDFPWVNQEITIVKRLIDQGYRIFRRHKYSEQESEEEKIPSFNLSKTIRASFQPSNYRRTSLAFENHSDNDRVFLLRWSGSANIDPEGLFNLTKDSN